MFTFVLDQEVINHCFLSKLDLNVRFSYVAISYLGQYNEVSFLKGNFLSLSKNEVRFLLELFLIRGPIVSGNL